MMYNNNKEDTPYSTDKEDIFSRVLGNWKKSMGKKKDRKTENFDDDVESKDDEFDALDELATLDQKAQDIKKKTIKRFVYVMLFLSVGMFIITGLIKFTHIMLNGGHRAPIKTPVEKVKLEINTFTKWQDLKDQQIGQLSDDINKTNIQLTNKILNVKKELKNDLNQTTSIITVQMKKNQIENAKIMDSMLDEIKKEILESEKNVKNYTDAKNISIDEKIEKIKEETKKAYAKGGPKLDFTKLSLPKLPSLGKNPISSNSVNSNVNISATNNKLNKKKIEVVTVEADIAPAETLNISTLDESNSSKTDGTNMPEFLLMPGFTKGTLIAGGDIPTLAAGKNSPRPVWISFNGDTLIANNDTMNVNDCLLQGSATGDFASGVAEIRLSRMSCSATNQDGEKFKVIAKVKGWVYSENGKYGLKGRLVSKEGEIISKAIPLSMLEGLIKALGNAGSLLVPSSGTTTGTANTPADTLKNSLNSAGSASGKVLGKLSDYYLKLLEALNPVIEIKAGREVVVAFQGGEKLKFEKYTPVDVDFLENMELDDE